MEKNLSKTDTPAPVIATREQVEQLKADWARDPIYDLVPGPPCEYHNIDYSPYEKELREFEQQKEREWQALAERREQERLEQAKAEMEKMGLTYPGQLALYQKLTYLENTLKHVMRDLYCLRDTGKLYSEVER